MTGKAGRCIKRTCVKGVSHKALRASRHLFQVQGEETAGRSRADQKERLQYLAAGTAGTTSPQKAGYGFY